jgi:predicted ester cyclase
MKKLCMILPLALILCFMVGCQDKEAMAELEQSRVQAALEEQNIEIVRDFFKAIDERNTEKLMKLLPINFNLTSPDITEFTERVKLVHFRDTFYKSFPDTTHMIDELIVEGDKVAVKFHINATHEADYEGIPATGTKVKQYSMSIMKVVDGEIKEMWILEDALALMQQLGMELKPKEGEK